MNKYQEAYQRLTNRIYKNDHIEDVYKATPKKANIMGEFVGECPNCHKILLGAVADYCFHCGQHLDWSEEENCDEE